MTEKKKWKYQGRLKLSVQDRYETPIEAWADILKYFKKDDLIYDPFYFNGATLTHLKKLGYNNVYHKKEDAFIHKIMKEAIVITNPPWSIKAKVFDYYDVTNNKVALLLPMDTMERKYMKKYLKNFQLIIPNFRYDFDKSKKGHPAWKACWFCWNLQKELETNEKLIWL
tara:strand:- start:132 stop:638 length:507 start_codon:yes stop_codon:yes gene_type:complete